MLAFSAGLVMNVNDTAKMVSPSMSRSLVRYLCAADLWQEAETSAYRDTFATRTEPVSLGRTWHFAYAFGRKAFPLRYFPLLAELSAATLAITKPDAFGVAVPPLMLAESLRLGEYVWRRRERAERRHS